MSLSLPLLLHGNNFDDWLLAGGGLVYLLSLYIYSELKKNKLKREKARRKAARLALPGNPPSAEDNSPGVTTKQP